jgi:hypothetical protein
LRSRLVRSIPEGALILARKGETVHTCVVITDYSSVMIDSIFSYYYAWSMTIDSCILVYDDEVMTVLDDTTRYNVKVEYSDLGVAEGYSINPFRWIPNSSTNPQDFEHCDDHEDEVKPIFDLSGTDSDE